MKEWHKEFKQLINSIDLDQVRELASQMVCAEQIFIAGNGGSYGNATHIAGDFLINSNLMGDIYCLGDNHVAATCISNDVSYQDVFRLEYLKRRRAPSLVIALSTSGKSKNILSLAEAAHFLGDTVFSITGSDPAPELKAHSTVNIRMEGTDAGFLEAAYDYIGHLLIREVARQLGDWDVAKD